jgi:flagellar protein FlbT
LKNAKILDGLAEVRDFFERGRPFDALKVLRPLFAIEDEILAQRARSDISDIHQQCEVP